MSKMFRYLKVAIILFHILVICLACELLDNNPDAGYTPTLVEEDNILKDNSEYIVVIGDIQEYTNNVDYAKYIGQTMDWIWSQVKHGKNIKCVLQTGDLTWYNMRSQYGVFIEYTTPVATLIPYISCPGNHDYDYGEGSIIADRYSTLFSEFTQFNHVCNRIVNRFEPDRMENIIVENYIGNERYDIVALEFGPRVEVIDWVKEHIQSNPEIRYILMTHEDLTGKGVRISTGAYSTRQLRNTTTTTPEQLWQQLINENNNIVCVLCGHNGFSAHLFSENTSGREVAQILFNLKYQDNGGDGWIQLWEEFPKNSNYVNVDTYNTISRQYHN